MLCCVLRNRHLRHSTSRRHFRTPTLPILHPTNLPPSGPPCDFLLPLTPSSPALALDVLGPVAGSLVVAVVVALGLAADILGLVPWSLEVSRLMKTVSSTSCSIGLDAFLRLSDIGGPAGLRHPSVAPCCCLPSPPAHARPQDSDKDSEPKDVTRPAGTVQMHLCECRRCHVGHDLHTVRFRRSSLEPGIDL